MLRLMLGGTAARALTSPSCRRHQVKLVGRIATSEAQLHSYRSDGLFESRPLAEDCKLSTPSQHVIETLRAQNRLSRPCKLFSTSASQQFGNRGSHILGRYLERKPLSVRVKCNSFRQFHASARRDAAGGGVIAMGGSIAAFLKSSYAIACMAGFSRLMFTLLPLSLLTTLKRNRVRFRWFELAPKIDPNVVEFWHRHCRMEKFDTLPRWKDAWNYRRMEGSTKLLQREEQYTGAMKVSAERIGLDPSYLDGKTLPAFEETMQPWRKFVHLVQIHVLRAFPPGSQAADALAKLTDEERYQLLIFRQWKGITRVYKNRVRAMNLMMWAIIFLPILGFGILALFSLERVPYTGRWRFIMLSPAEEDAVSSKLRGPGWYQTVISMLTTPDSPAPAILPIEDWRWNWVNGVLRRLETGVIEQCNALSKTGHQSLPPSMMEGLDYDALDHYLPPPEPAYRLVPRPRASALIHGAVPGSDPDTGREHLQVGPPYSLMLMQKDERNAMTYGFGSGGAGGVVVFTGILDEILSTTQGDVVSSPDSSGLLESQEPEQIAKTGEKTTIWSWLRNAFNAQRPTDLTIPNARPSPNPTDEQTLQLACVLAHELAHLLLSHHLESLSTNSVMVPTAAGLVSDFLRTLIFPITMLGGPFLNDAISKTFDVGLDESKAMGDVAFSRVQEREADLVSLRPSCRTQDDLEDSPEGSSSSVRRMSPWSFFRGGVHDNDEERFQALEKELDRWRRINQAGL